MNELKVMFVCLGNICRSPLAHALFEKKAAEAGLKVRVESSGTHADHIGEAADSRMRRTASFRGIEFQHYSRQFKASDLNKFDLIIAMDRINLQNIRNLARSRHRDKIHLMREWDPKGGTDVPDPWYGGQEGFEQVFDILDRSCDALINKLKTSHGNMP